MISSELPIRYVSMSHVDPDHTFGAVAFLQDKTAFVARRSVAACAGAAGEYYRERLEEVLTRQRRSHRSAHVAGQRSNADQTGRSVARAEADPVTEDQ